MDVSDHSLAEAGFLGIAGRLQLLSHELKDVLQDLANLKESWLLILDNADDPSIDYQKYFPSGSWGVVILTTRNEQCHRHAPRSYITLEGLSDIEAQSLLFDTAQIVDGQHGNTKDDAQAVSKLLGSHPLALIQAGTYVACGHSTLQDYPNVYARQRERLLRLGPSQAQPRYQNVYATFEASADALRSDSELASDAQELLSFLASLRRTPLPLSWFKAAWMTARTICSGKGDDDRIEYVTPWHVSKLLPMISTEKDEWDPFRLTRAVSQLKALALVSTNFDQDLGFRSLSMHSLIHAWANERRKSKERQDAWISAASFLSICSQTDIAWQPHELEIYPHVQALASSEMSIIFADKPLDMIVNLYLFLGWMLYEVRDDTGLAVLLERLFIHNGWDETTLIPECEEAWYLKANSHLRLGEFDKAIVLLNQMSECNELHEPANSHAMTKLQAAQIRAYLGGGQEKKAIKLMEEILNSLEGNDELLSLRLSLKHNLATTYHRCGKAEQASSLSNQIYDEFGENLQSRREDPCALLENMQISFTETVDSESYAAMIDRYLEGCWQVQGNRSKELERRLERSMYNWRIGRREASVLGMKQAGKLAQGLLGKDHPKAQKLKLLLDNQKLAIKHKLVRFYSD